MSSWERTTIAVGTKKHKSDGLKQLFECIADNEIDKEENVQGNMNFFADYSCETKLNSDEVPSVFKIFNSIYKGISVYWLYDEGSDTSDYYNTVDYLYDPIKKKCFYASCEYCDGDETAQYENIFQILRYEIEKEAKKRKIKINWNNEDNENEICPSIESEDFYELCYEIKFNHSSDELGTIKKEKPIDFDSIKINKGILRKMIKNAKTLGYKKIEKKLIDLEK